MKKKGLFSGKVRSKTLAEIITFEGIVKAKKAAITLKKRYRAAKRKDTRTLRRIAQIYRAAARDMK